MTAHPNPQPWLNAVLKQSTVWRSFTKICTMHYNAILAATWLLGRTTYRIPLWHRTQLAWPTPVQYNGTLLVQVKCPFPRSFSIYPKSQTVALRKLQPLLRNITMKISLLSIFFAKHKQSMSGNHLRLCFPNCLEHETAAASHVLLWCRPWHSLGQIARTSCGTAARFELYPNCRPKARRFQRLGVENHVGVLYRIKMESWMHLQYGKYHRLGIWSHLTRHPQQECCQQVPAVGIRSSEALAAEVAHSTWASNIDKKTNTLRKHSVDLMKCCILELPGSVIINSYGDQYLS